MMKNGYPPIIIKSEDKKGYLRALHQADAGEIDTFIDYIAEQELWSLDTSLKAARGENIDEIGDLDKKINLLKSRLKYNEDIKVEKSPDAIVSCYKTGIIPLINSLNNTLNRFASFFRDKRHHLDFYTNGGRVGNAIGGNEGITIVEMYRDTLQKIDFYYELSNFRQNDNRSSITAILEITLHQIVYEVKSPQLDVFYNKLYHENFSDNELIEISEKIGNYFVEKIESDFLG